MDIKDNFQFSIPKRLKYTGVIWASLAMVALSYFLVYKGLKSTYTTENLTKTELISYIQSINPKAADTLSNDNKVVIVDTKGREMIFNKTTTSENQVSQYEVFLEIKILNPL